MNFEENQLVLLKYLYDCNMGFPDPYDQNWRDFAKAKGIDIGLMDDAYDLLHESGLVQARSLGPYAEITTWGVLQAESSGIVDEAIVNSNNAIRRKILDGLALVREEHGVNGYIDWQSLTIKIGISDDEFRREHQILNDIGYIKFESARGLKITTEGYAKALEFRSQDDLVSKFNSLESLSSMSPQARGLEFERLIGKIVSSDGWNVAENVNSSTEQHDLLINQSREYYVVECKWTKEPLDAATMRNFRDKVTARIGTRGIIFSIGGFTEEAVETATTRLESAMVLLFGREDVESILSRSIPFTVLLNQKFDVAVGKRRLEFR